MKSCLPEARQSQTLNAVVASLSQCLHLDAGVLIPELRQAEEANQRNTDNVTNVEEQAVVQTVEEEMNEEEEPKKMKNGKTVTTDTDFSDLLPVGLISDFYMSHSGENSIEMRIGLKACNVFIS